MSESKYYTGVGSREAPYNKLHDAAKIAERMLALGYGLRSGHAQGMDMAFEGPVSRLKQSSGSPSDITPSEIYLPWDGFQSRRAGGMYIDANTLELWSEAKEMVSDLHPAPHRLSPGALSLHVRNVFQVLGQDLQTPSEFVVFWAVPISHNKKEKVEDKDAKIITTADKLPPQAVVKGGTNTAVYLAMSKNIPVYNLHDTEQSKTLLKYIKELESKRG